MIFRKEENLLYKTCLSPSADKDKLIKTGDYIEIDDSIIPDSDFLKLDDDNNIVIDIERRNEFLTENNKKTVRNILSKTDFLLLIDNPKDLTEEEIKELIEYRKSLRNSTIELPLMPEFIKIILGE